MFIILKALILYASDTPELLPYFSRDFTKRLNEEKIFEAYQDKSIANVWMFNNVEIASSHDIEKKLLSLIENLKKNSITAKTACKQMMGVFENNPVEISKSILAEFYFWSFIRELNSSKDSIEYFSAYEKYATLAQKDELESQLDSSLLKKIQQFSKQIQIKQKKIQILNSNNCLVYINGQIEKSNFVYLPKSLHSTISAKCNIGTFAQTFVPLQVQSVKIEPHIPNHLKQMPSISTLPKDLIAQEKVDRVVLIYWSKGMGYIDSLILDAKNFETLKSIHLSLKDKKDFDRVGDRLSFFLNHKG